MFRCGEVSRFLAFMSHHGVGMGRIVINEHDAHYSITGGLVVVQGWNVIR